MWTLQKHETRIRRRYAISRVSLDPYLKLCAVARNFKAESDVGQIARVTAFERCSPYLYSQCVVANIDADAVPNKPLAAKYGVTGFPTIKFFSKDTKEPIAYEGGRTEADFVSFLNEKCGTHRAVGGGLNDKVSSAGCKLFTRALMRFEGWPACRL